MAVTDFTIANNLKKYRKMANLTQDGLREALNSRGYDYRHSSISSWELGTKLPPIDVIKVLADILNIDIILN